jgi:hypothetical protein
MKTQTTNTEEFESTYAMLVRSEEKERSASETLVYGLIILSAIASVWQLALHPITVPTNLMRSAAASHSANPARPAA